MKYAFVTFSAPDAEWSETLDIAARYGYDGVEIRADNGHRHGIGLGMPAERRAQVREEAAAKGIRMCGLGVSSQYADPRTADKHEEETIGYLQLARDLGVPLVRVFCGMIPAGADKAETMARIVDSLRRLAPYAEEAGVRIAVETHDDWSDPADMAEIMRRVDHGHVRVVWDVMHTFRTGGRPMAEAYRMLRPWIVHVHVHDGLLAPDYPIVFKPIGSGDIDHKAALAELIEDGYDGFVSGEWLNWEPPDVHLPRELAALKRCEAELRLRR